MKPSLGLHLSGTGLNKLEINIAEQLVLLEHARNDTGLTGLNYLEANFEVTCDEQCC